MAITGNTTINVGLPNESANSDSLYTAFNKINNNFNILFANASPNVVAGTGINVAVANNVATVTNTGVTSIVAGANIIVSNVGGVYTISTGNINSIGTVTSVNVVPVSSSRITSVGGPITTYGTINLDLATTGVTAGTYTSPIITIDAYGRIISATAGAGSGTVSSVGLTPGSGIQVTGGPITTSGNITVTNTGVTGLSAGPGIALSGSNGNVTITSTLALSSGVGTVTNVDIASNTLVVTGGPISTAGTFNVELPGNINANILTVNASTTNSLVTLTQRGTGNALVVEDAATDTTPFIINNAGYVITGYTGSINGAVSSSPSRIQINDFLATQEAYWGNNIYGPIHQYLKSRSGTTGTHAIVQDNDFLGAMYFAGSSGSQFITGATISAAVDGTPTGSSTSMPSRLTFNTRSSTGTSSIERMRISSSGNVGININDPQANLHVSQKALISTTGNSAALQLQQNTGTADNNIWQIKTFNSTGSLRLQAIDDAGAGGGSVIDVKRSGNNITGAVISLSSSETALRITQTGSGNALVVEDSSNPDITPFVVSNLGAVIIGYTETIDSGSKLEVVDSHASIYQYTTGTAGAYLNLKKSSNNTTGGHGLVNNGDTLGQILTYASDGTQFARAVDITMLVDGVPVLGSNSVPSKLQFKTVGPGNTLPTTRQVIYGNGSVDFTSILSLSGSEDLADGAAANLLVTASYFTTGATGETATLAAGTGGMIKTFMMRGDGGGDMVITVTSAGWKTSGTGTMTFDTIGDSCVLQYINSKWFCVGNNGVVFA